MSRLRSDEKVTPSTRTWSDTMTVFESIRRDKPLLPNENWLCFEPASRFVGIKLKAVHRHPVADFCKA